VASAFGFGLAYYFDTQRGAARRQRLREQLRGAARKVDGVFAPAPAVDDLPAVFHPLLRGLPKQGAVPPRPPAKTG
jgi:hypothetical protein